MMQYLGVKGSKIVATSIPQGSKTMKRANNPLFFAAMFYVSILYSQKSGYIVYNKIYLTSCLR